MIRFILNDRELSSALHPATTLLDFIRYEKHLTGTKIGCREGDCGACSVLVGELSDGQLTYRNMTSCLIPLANVSGKHVVTIEGINQQELSPVQEAFVSEGATQCGFCTPGFIISLTGFCLNDDLNGAEDAVAAMAGNICRCTGYKSIERAAANIAASKAEVFKSDGLAFSVGHKIVPEYFTGIADRLKAIHENAELSSMPQGEYTRMGGGTDIFVQRHHTVKEESIDFLLDNPSLKGIMIKDNFCEIGAAVTVAELLENEAFLKAVPQLPRFMKLVSSMPIRNMATLAGNFINASPIGDMTIFFLALNAKLQLNDGKNRRNVNLRDFYKGYKILDRKPEEYVEKILLELPDQQDKFNFEKVSKRTHLDIASVNSALFLSMKDDVIVEAGLSAGGVGPVPLFIKEASAYMKGKAVNVALVHELTEMVQKEIAPISDARGTEAYKRLLLAQLIKAHFVSLFPELPINHLMELE